MRRRVTAYICVIGLAIGLLCPSICAAISETPAPEMACCTTTHSQTHTTSCADHCSMHQEPLTLSPAVTPISSPDLFTISVVSWPIHSITLENNFEHAYVAITSHQPGYLVCLKSIRIQC